VEGNASFVRLCKGCAHLAVASVNPAPPQSPSARYAKAPDLVCLLPTRQGEPPGENPAPVWCLLPIRRSILPAALASAPEPGWLSRDFGREAALPRALGHSALREPDGLNQSWGIPSYLFGVFQTIVMEDEPFQFLITLHN